jgi:hypothetical protein
MAVRHQVFQRVQLGVEVTPGTPVAANKRLLATYFRPTANVPRDPHTTVGSRFNSGSSEQKEWTGIELNGRMAFNDLAYIFNSLLLKSTGAGPWTFKPTPEAVDTLGYYTFQHGDAVNAEQVAHCNITGCSLRMNRTTAEVRGTGIGRPMAEAATLTGSPAKVPKVLVDPESFDILVGDSVAGLTRINKGFEVAFNYGGARDGLFPMRADQDSFDELVEDAPDVNMTLNLQHDATAVGYMADLRAATQKYIRIIALGPEYSVGVPYKFQLTMAFVFSGNERGESNKVHASTFTLIPDDSEVTIGSPIEVVIDSNHVLP